MLVDRAFCFSTRTVGGLRPSPGPTIGGVVTEMVTGRQSGAIHGSKATISQVAHIPTTITEYAVGEPKPATATNIPDPQYQDPGAGGYRGSLTIYIEAKVNEPADS